MRWRKSRRSTNVVDRRDGGRGGFGGRMSRGGMRVGVPRSRRGKALGGGGIVTLLLVLGALLFGVDPSFILGGGTVATQGGYGGGYSSTETPGVQANDQRVEFVARVLGETEDTWNQVFDNQLGEPYVEPTLVVFDDEVSSACGYASSASGPFYCPADRQIYIDLAFFDELSNRFGAVGDFAQAYVVAHEVGHHVQNLLGILPEVARMRRELSQTEANRLTVMLELQADCLSGVWARTAEEARGILEQGDIEEALNAAAAIGDDRLQRQSRGYVVPDSFTHGTSEQRARWFATGFESGQVASCDTFNAPAL